MELMAPILAVDCPSLLDVFRSGMLSRLESILSLWLSLLRGKFNPALRRVSPTVENEILTSFMLVRFLINDWMVSMIAVRPLSGALSTEAVAGGATRLAQCVSNVFGGGSPIETARFSVKRLSEVCHWRG